jgi:hypothetical protein
MFLSTNEALALTEQIENVINGTKPTVDLDDNIRRRLREAGRKLSASMEVPGDTINRINNTVSFERSCVRKQIKYVDCVAIGTHTSLGFCNFLFKLPTCLMTSYSITSCH